MMILRYDSSGNVLWNKEYIETLCTDTIFYNVRDFKPTGTGEWLALATLAYPDLNGTQTDFVLSKLDSNFNIEWSKEYGDHTQNDIADKLLITDDGYVMGGGRSNYNVVIYAGFTDQAEIIKTDTAGNQQWIWLSDINKQTNTIQDIIQTPDGGYVYCGQGNGYETDFLGNGTLYYKGWVEKLDSGRNVLWNDTFSATYSNTVYNSLNVLKLLPDSSIMIAGQITGGFDPIDTEDRNYGVLIKMNENGQVLWKRKYSYPNDTLVYEVFDMKPTLDSGFVFCGQADNQYNTQPLPNQRGWIVKVDSNGCMGPGDPNCMPVAVKVTSPGLSKGEVIVYPNPVTNSLTLSLSEGEGTARVLPAGVQIFNIVGSLVYSGVMTENKMIISTKDLSAGAYILRLTGRDGVVMISKIVK